MFRTHTGSGHKRNSGPCQRSPFPGRCPSTQQAGAAPLHSLGRPWFCEDSSERAPRPPPFPPPTVTPAAKQPPSSWPLQSLHRCSLFLTCHASQVRSCRHSLPTPATLRSTGLTPRASSPSQSPSCTPDPISLCPEHRYHLGTHVSG